MFRSNSTWKYKKNKLDANSPRESHKEFIKKQWILTSQQRFRSDIHVVFTEDVNKIALSANDDKRI